MIDDIDIKWYKVEKWWNNINIESNIFPEYLNKPLKEEKNVFNIKLLYIIKQLFSIDDINKISKINKININVLNLDNLKLLAQDNIELINIINYLLPYNIYFNKLKNKILDIFTIIFNDVNFNNMFKCDDDLTRIIAPIIAHFIYIYLITRNIDKSINLFLKLDNNGIIFFIISYSILDNLMDNYNESLNNKKIFLKWFMNIIDNPDNEISLSDNEKNIWQCITFSNYFLIFRKQYPVCEYQILYKFVKILIFELNEANIIQQNILSTEEQILKHTFKKSYVVSVFTVLLINSQIKNINNEDLEKNMDILCILLFLIQLYDDFIDIDKDIIEQNYTYFNSNNIKLSLNNRIKKIIIASFKLIEELNENNNNILNIMYYIVKNTSLNISFYHTDKINNDLIDYLFEYSLLLPSLLKFFDKNIYNSHNSDLIIKNIKNII